MTSCGERSTGGKKCRHERTAGFSYSAPPGPDDTGNAAGPRGDIKLRLFAQGRARARRTARFGCCPENKIVPLELDRGFNRWLPFRGAGCRAQLGGARTAADPL